MEGKEDGLERKINKVVYESGYVREGTAMTNVWLLGSPVPHGLAQAQG